MNKDCPRLRMAEANMFRTNRSTHHKRRQLKVVVFFLFCSFFHVAIAQNQENTFSIQARIVDSLNLKAMPFVSVYKTRDKIGTLSDFNGEFILDNILPNDSLVFSSIGYEKLVLAADPKAVYHTIYLNPEARLLDEVMVLANNSILYEIVSNARKTHANTREIAKSYFELESFHNGKQLELFQGYYNGTFQGYNVADLAMKNGRFALAPLSKRLFASTESSRALYMHNMIQTNEFFPKSPFEFNKQKLMKHYALTLNSKYQNADKRTIYAISFEPKSEKNAYFSGKVWIDSLSNCIQKTQLRISNADIYPFRALWPEHTLDTVNIEITKSYSLEDAAIRLNTVHFNYDMIYQTLQDSSMHIATQAVLHAYNYDKAFVLPFFEFPRTSSADYRRIQMLPHNGEFWNCTDEFKIENNAAKNDFINDPATIGSYDLFMTDTIFEKNFFENPYVSWNGNRILIKGLSADSANYYTEKKIMNSERYNLKVQLFVDVNELCDSIQLITKTIFDPYESFYHFETTPESQAFLNIYFDLMEIERRRLEIELELVKTNPELIQQVYKQAVDQANKLSAVYFKEVQRGTNKEALKKWNALVLDTLTIDNIGFFGLEME